MRELGEAMRLGAASLQNAFGDERALFITRCLDRTTRERIARLKADHSPLAATEAFLAEIVERSLADRRGCLLVNPAPEVAPHDPEIVATIAGRLGEIEDFFRRWVAAVREDGSIAQGRDACDLARLLLTTALGLRVLARARPDPDLLRGAARQALAPLIASLAAPHAPAPDPGGRMA